MSRSLFFKTTRNDETRLNETNVSCRLWQAKITEDLQVKLRLTLIFFFAEMVEDWTVNYKPDLLTFVPYEWSFNIILRDFEMVWLGNQHNWIECNSNKQENGELNSCFFLPTALSECGTTNATLRKVPFCFL